MPAATDCILLELRRIDVNEALSMRQAGMRDYVEFRCVECGRPVRVHDAGGHAAAHFEHLERNPRCSRSDTLK